MSWLTDAKAEFQKQKAAGGLSTTGQEFVGRGNPPITGVPGQPVPSGGYKAPAPTGGGGLQDHVVGTGQPMPFAGGVDKGPAWTQGPAAFGGDYERWFAALMQGFDPNSDSLEKMGAILGKYGVKLRPNAEGTFGKIELPNGQVIDVGRSFSSGDPNRMKWQWLTGGGAGAGAGAAGAQGNSPYAAGSALAPWTQQFQAPSAQDALNSPGLQYALDRAGQAIMRNRAARGVATTGGTVRDLSENQIGIALQGYGDVYDRSMGEYGLRRDIFESNQDRPWAKLLQLGTLGKPT